jgi:hypothetical protein
VIKLAEILKGNNTENPKPKTHETKIRIQGNVLMVNHIWGSGETLFASDSGDASVYAGLDGLYMGNKQQFDVLMAEVSDVMREKALEISLLAQFLNLGTRVEDLRINELYTARFGEVEKRHIEKSARDF